MGGWIYAHAKGALGPDPVTVHYGRRAKAHPLYGAPACGASGRVGIRRRRRGEVLFRVTDALEEVTCDRCRAVATPRPVTG